MSESFFRSLSLVEDLREPRRFAHYRPTRKSAPILEAILNPRTATMVIAPYGSGKSLAAGVGALAVRNDPAAHSQLESLARGVSLVAPEIGRRLQERLEGRKCGKVVVLSGHAPDALAQIGRQLGLSPAPATMEAMTKGLVGLDADHVAIVWDEFGRHLEGLVADGRTADMDLIQRLAERASRASGPTLSFTLLLHQNLLAYASRLNETTRSEWRKIEGRFQPLRMEEDSQEIYALAAEVVAALRSKRPRTSVSRQLVDRIQAARWLDGMESPDRVAEVLESAWPLTAGALQILPSLVARVGQNERSLFTFLRDADLTRRVGVEEVYAAFADAMRSDVGIGGSYRRWVESESARSRAKDPLQRELIAAACLLQLGVSGERLRLPRAVLELAVHCDGRTPEEVSRAVDDLIAANLLLWRRHNDDVAVWHGADIDVGLRVREERDRVSRDFDLLAFLSTRFPPPHLRAPGHNARFGVNRFFRGRYATAEELESVTAEGVGSIVYILARTTSEIDAARDIAARQSHGSALIHVVPRRPIEAGAAALELVAIESLRADADFMASDPMVKTELDELQSVAFEQLALSLRPLLSPQAPSAEWWAEGRRLEVTQDRPGTMAASDLLNAWYPLTPRIENDQLMRDQASRTMQTARVRLVTSIFERGDKFRFGLEDGDRSAEGSIYRTVFARTGLRREDDGRYATLKEIAEPGLAEAWRVVADFFRTPTGAPRPFGELIDKLQARPIGLPRAVTPLLVAAGYEQFAQTVALYREGAYAPDILGYGFDGMVMNPEGVTIQVVASGPQLNTYLRELCYAFQHEHPGSSDELFRRCYDAIQRWRLTVPESARRTQKLGERERRLLTAVSASSDPIELTLRRIPAVFGSQGPDHRIIRPLEQARKAIDELRDIFAEEAIATVMGAFQLRQRPAQDLLGAVREWASCFDSQALIRGGHLRISDQAVLARAVETANGRFSPKSFAGALSSILLKCGLEKWDDRSAAEFRTALREARERIEAAALQGPPQEALRPLLEARIEDLQLRLAALDAATEAQTQGGAA